MVKKNCLKCGNSFETNNSRKVYCKNSCKVLHHRKRNNIDEPDFLTTKKEPKPKLRTQTVEKEREVAFKEPNPDHEHALANANHWETHYNGLQSRKETLIKKLDSILNHDTVLKSGLIGLAAGHTLSDDRVKTQNAVIFGLLGLVIGKTIESQEEYTRVNKLNEIKREINGLDDEINNALISKQYFLTASYALPKFIEKTRKETYLETVPYTDFEELKVPVPVIQPIKLEREEKNKSGVHVMSLQDFQKVEFNNLEMSNEYKNLFGNPPENFCMLVYGESGNGKSTWSINFAEYLANNHGKVLFNSSEEGLGETLKRKLIDKSSRYLDLSQCKNFENLKATLPKKGKYRFLFIDSVNDMNLTVKDLKELRTMDDKRAIIYIMQATKGGEYKGDSGFRHEADYVIKLDNYTPICEKKR
jgi:hypothetical protein